MRFLLATILILVATAQGTLFTFASWFGIAPNLVLVLVLVLSTRFGVREGIVWAFGAGLMLDLLVLDPLGTNALALFPVAIIGGIARRPMLQSGLLLTMLMVLLATLAHFSVASLIDTLSGTGFAVSTSIRLGLVTSFLNTLVVPPLYGLVILLDRFGVHGVAQA
jgi:rod shape-determining protein MreD